jgi:hypothetical protein
MGSCSLSACKLDLESKKRLKHVHAKLHAWDKEVLKASKKRLHAYLNEDLEQTTERSDDNCITSGPR